MRSSYSIIFGLCFGALLLCMPAPCRAALAPWQRNRHASIPPRLFNKLIEVTSPHPRKPNRPFDVEEELKIYLLTPSKVYPFIVTGYFRLNFPSHKTFPGDLLSVILHFYIGQAANYKERKGQLIFLASKARRWDLLTKYLASERRYRLYKDTKNGVFSNSKRYHDDHINMLTTNTPYVYALYTYQNNFLNKELLFWLMAEHHCPVPTNADITALSRGRYSRLYKEHIYKMKAIELLIFKNEADIAYRVLCFHLLNKQLIAQRWWSWKEKKKLMQLRDRMCKGPPYLVKLRALLSTIYWARIGELSVIDTISGLALNLFAGPIFMTFTFYHLLLLACFSMLIYAGYRKSCPGLFKAVTNSYTVK